MMVQYSTNPDVVVIGAGAAGIGAGRALAKAGISFHIIEAKDRIGGRSFTDTTSLGHLWDQGCHWFHSADKNILRKLAEEKGVQYAKEASGHRSDRYIWRYVQPDRQSLADAIDAMD